MINWPDLILPPLNLWNYPTYLPTRTQHKRTLVGKSFVLEVVEIRGLKIRKIKCNT